jgi:thiamine pyrophosphate-dependent acetolactate synthase large subunit-like protein
MKKAPLAADAEAQITGKLAVCAGSSGRAILQRRTGTRHRSA